MKMRPALFLLTFCILIPPAADAWRVEYPEDEEQNLMCGEPLSKEVGEDVTLDCHHQTGLDVTEESVYWKFNNDIYVLVFRDRKISYYDQEEQFKGRASKDSSWNPAEGKLSLKISPVKAEDAGTYTCYVRCQTYTCYVRRLKMSCSTSLSIKPSSDNSKMVTEIGGSIGGVGTVLIVIIVCLVFYCFKTKKSFFGHI